MKIRDSPKIAFKSINNNTSKFYTIESEERGKVFIEFDYIIRNTNISKKQLDLYLWRHPEIETYKDGKIKYISLEILPYIFTSSQKKIRKF